MEFSIVGPSKSGTFFGGACIYIASHAIYIYNSICRSLDIMEFSIVGPPKSGTFFGGACMIEALLYIYN